MNKVFIIEIACVVVTLFFYIIMLATQKRRVKKIGKSAGMLIFKTASPSKNKTLALWCVIPLVLVLAFLVNYSPFFVILISAICSLAIFIVCREDACDANNGVYQDALIGGGEIIPYKKIKSISPDSFVPENLIMEIELIDSKKIAIQFASEEEYKTAKENICKRLEK